MYSYCMTRATRGLNGSLKGHIVVHMSITAQFGLMVFDLR